MRNKRYELVLCVCLAICLMAFATSGLLIGNPAVTLNASSSQTATVILTPSDLNPSGEFTVTVAVNTQVNSYGITGEITFDNTRLEYVPSGETGGVAGNVYAQGTSSVIADFIDITASFSQKEFVLATLTFKVKRGAPAGEAVFSYTSMNYFDTLVRAVNVTSENVTVAVEENTDPSTGTIEIEIDGISLTRDGEVWRGSVPYQITQIDTKDIRVIGAHDDAQIEFSQTGIIELEENIAKEITVVISYGDSEEVHKIAITRMPEMPKAMDRINEIGEYLAKNWMIFAAVALIVLVMLARFRRYKRINS